MVSIVETDAKSILSAATGFMAPYDFTISPYRGCLFDCSYCYVPTLYPFRGDARAWGETLVVKRNAVGLLRRAAAAGKIDGKRIYCSPVTDPYVGPERRYRLTRGILEACRDSSMALLVLQTRSPLVERDLDAIAALGDRVVVALTLPTDRDDVRRCFEPRSASIARRVETLDRLQAVRAAGVRIQISLSPLLPCDPDALDDLVRDRCDWVVAQPLKAGGTGARTRPPALEIAARESWQGWFAGGPEVAAALAALRSGLGPRFHEGRKGYALDWLTTADASA